MKSSVLAILEVDTMKKKGMDGGTVYKTEDEILNDDGQLISKTKSGHLVYRTGNKRLIRKEYHAVNPETKKVDISVDANDKNNVLSRILLVANKGNTISAADFYHHLIMVHNKILVHDVLSPGGKAVLKKLNTKYHSTVTTHGWLRGQPVNVTDKDDEYVYASGGETPEIRDAENINLVTFKK